MAFWGVEVKPGKHFTLKATDATEIKRLHLSQATLGIGNATTTRSVVQCIVGNKSPLFLCGLSPQKVDSCQLNIEFEEAEDVIFSVLGPLSVHLTGYFLGRGSTAFRLHDDESESFGEDIVDTDVEKGSSDDYDYSDSFINDDDPSARSSHISSTDDDDEISIKERAAKKEKKKSKKGGRLRKKFQVPDSESDANEDSVEILNDQKISKVLSSEVRVTRSKARSSTLENGEPNAKGEKKTSEATTHADKRKDKPSASVESSPIKTGSEVISKKKRNKESDVDDEEGKNKPENQKPATDKAIESSNKKRKKDRKEETRARKKQALDKNTQVGTEKLPEPDKLSDEVRIEEITKGNVDGKVAAQGKKVSILYTAKLKDSGKLIESNSKEAPLRFRIGGEKVIKGLSIGVEGMRVGDKRRLIIPPSLGYSEEGLKKEDVPKNAWLVYEVEAVKVR